MAKFSMQLFNFVIIKVKLFIKFLVAEILAMKLFIRKSTNHYVSNAELLIVIIFLITEFLA